VGEQWGVYCITCEMRGAGDVAIRFLLVEPLLPPHPGAHDLYWEGLIIRQEILLNILSSAKTILSRSMWCDYRRGFWIVGFIDHLQVATTNNYNTITDLHTYSSLEHTVYCSQSVTKLSW
jgi:hypothetical protein